MSRLFTACLTALLVLGCEGPTPGTLGSAGGRVLGPNGSELSVPSGALKQEVQITLALPPVGTRPPLPLGVAPIGATYAVAPVGMTFAAPAQVAIPFDPAQVPRGARPLLLSSGGEFNAPWHAVSDARPAGSRMHGMTDGAGTFVVVVRLEIPSLTTNEGDHL